MLNDERFVTPYHYEEEEIQLEQSLRPKYFQHFIGQQKTKEKLMIYIKAAIERGEPLDHVLLFGPPGLGKTTIAHIIVRALGVNIRITSGPAIERPGDLASILTNLGDNDVLFIDEIHRLHRSIEEVLYPAMEDYALDIIIGKGPAARSLRLDLKPFTLIGATTRAGMISSPLRDRFGVITRMDYYLPQDLAQIILNNSHSLRIKIEEEGASVIAHASRGTPRVANRLLKRVRDYAQVKAGNCITKSVAKEALLLLEVDERGLDNVDRQLLSTIIEKFSGGPVGLETIAAAINEDAETIEDVYEPFLMQLGFLNRTPRGRVVTDEVYHYLGINARGRQNKFWN